MAKIGENIQISRHHRLEVTGNGLVGGYIHTGAKVGVLVEVAPARKPTGDERRVQATGARHHACRSLRHIPLPFPAQEIDPAIVAKEKEIAAEQVKDKPPQAIAKIVEGKLEKFYQGDCLVDQGFVKKNSEVTVKEHIAGSPSNWATRSSSAASCASRSARVSR